MSLIHVCNAFCITYEGNGFMDHVYTLYTLTDYTEILTQRIGQCKYHSSAAVSKRHWRWATREREEITSRCVGLSLSKALRENEDCTHKTTCNTARPVTRLFSRSCLSMFRDREKSEKCLPINCKRESCSSYHQWDCSTWIRKYWCSG